MRSRGWSCASAEARSLATRGKTSSSEKAPAPPLEVAGLAKELEVASTWVELNKVEDGVWKLAVRLKRPEMAAAEKKRLDDMKSQLAKLQKALQPYYSRHAGLAEKVDAVMAVAREMKLKLPPRPPYEPEGDHVGEWKKAWRIFWDKADEQVPAAVKGLNEQVNKLRTAARKADRDQEIGLQGRLDRLKEASAVLYHLLDNRIRVEDVVIGEM